jgi:hypothetical protein
MLSTSLFRPDSSPARRTNRRGRRPQASSCRLTLEAFETRTVPSVAFIPLPPAPAGYPLVSSATARLDGHGEVFGTATYSTGGFLRQYTSEAFTWTAAGGTQLLVDPASQQPYSAVVDLGTDGSILVRSNNPDPYTSYFDLLSPGSQQASLVPLPPAPAGYPLVSSATARLDGHGEVFGTATYSTGGFLQQYTSEAFTWTAAGATQLLIDPASQQPYSAVVDLGTGGSILVRSNNPDPYTSYFDLLSPGSQQVTLIPLPPAPAGYPMVSSATARLDALGEVFGTGTYSNGSVPPQYQSEAFTWKVTGGSQLLIDPVSLQPYTAVVDVGTDDSVLLRSNNADPDTSYFDLLSPTSAQPFLIALPPAPAGYPRVSSATARLDGQGDVFGTGTYSNGGFPPQYQGEAFTWTAAGGTQLVVDPASQQPYSALVDFGTDGSVLVRSNNPDPYTSYFDLLSPDGHGGPFLADPGASPIRRVDGSLPPDPNAPGVVGGGRQTGQGHVSDFTDNHPPVTGLYLQPREQALLRTGDRVPQVLTNQTNYLLGVFDDPMVEAVVYLPAT